MKKIVKCILFISLFGIIWNCLFNILWLSDTPISNLYKERENSIDIIYLGSSNAYAHYNTTLGYHLYGFTTGFMSTDSQPPVTLVPLMKETQKRQKPSLYVIDISRFGTDSNLYNEGDIRRTTDSMKFSRNRNDAIKASLKFTNVMKNDPTSKAGNNYYNYYFSFLLYHNSWKNLQLLNFKGRTNLYKGYLFDNYRIKKVPQKKFIWSENNHKLPKENKEALLDLLEYVKKENLNVLFLIPIRNMNEWIVGRLGEATSIIEKKGYKVINFNTLKDFTVDFNTDFYNQNHLNVYGATKYTLYFSNYLKEHYELKDHRKDKKYQSWEKEYQRLKKDFKDLTDRDFDNLLKIDSKNSR